MFVQTTTRNTISDVAIASKELSAPELPRESQVQPTHHILSDISDLVEDHIFCALLRNFAHFEITKPEEPEQIQETLVDCVQESKTTISNKSSHKDSSQDLAQLIDKKPEDLKRVSRASTRASTRAVHLSKRKSKSSRSTRAPRKSETEDKTSQSQGGEEEERKIEVYSLPPKENPFELNFDHIYDVTGEDRNLMKHLMECLSFDFLNGNVYEGNIGFLCKDGRGVYQWSDGSKFSGKFMRDSPNGYGCMEWSDGDRYEGYFIDGERNGSGSFTIRASTMNHIYSGYWLKGFQSGKGTLKYSEKNWYDGNFENGLFHGLGLRNYPSGGQYIGRWKNGKKNGHGTMLFSNNDMFIGDWVNGKMEGTGKYIWETFLNEQFVYPMHNLYSGQWKDGKRNGLGSLILSSGAVITTLWKDNVKHGWGKLLCTNGTTIECDPLFVNDNLVSMKKAEYRNELISEIDDLQMDLSKNEANGQHLSASLIQWKGIDCLFEPYRSCTSPINLPPYFMNIDVHIQKLFHLDNWVERIQVLNWCLWSLDMPPWCDTGKSLNMIDDPSADKQNKNASKRNNTFDKLLSSKTESSKDSLQNGKGKSQSELSSDGSIRNLTSDNPRISHLNYFVRDKSEIKNVIDLEQGNIEGSTTNNKSTLSEQYPSKFSQQENNQSKHTGTIQETKSDLIQETNSDLTTIKNKFLNTSSFFDEDFIKSCKKQIYKFEKKWLRNTIIKHISALRKLYNRYAKICCKEKPQFECGLLRIMLWKLLKDINFWETGFSLVELDEMAVGKTDPFDYVSMSEMIHYLLIVAWELYTKRNKEKIDTPGLLASGFNAFVLERLKPLIDSGETYEPLFRNSDMIPIEALYRLYESVGPNLTIKTLVHRLIRKADRNYDNHNISILPEPNEFFIHTLKGQNGILPGGEIIYKASKLPDFEYIPEDFRKPPEQVKSVDLDFLGTLGNDSIVECVIKCFPQVTNNRGEILQQNYRICFLEFLEVLTECINEYLKRMMKFSGSQYDDKRIEIMDKCLDLMLKKSKTELQSYN